MPKPAITHAQTSQKRGLGKRGDPRGATLLGKRKQRRKKHTISIERKSRKPRERERKFTSS
jgi:hypothetical protein